MHFQHCDKSTCLSNSTDFHSMISTPVVISDVRIPLLFIHTEENLKIINEYNITGFPITWIQIKHIIFRLIINPLEETIQTIQQ